VRFVARSRLTGDPVRAADGDGPSMKRKRAASPICSARRRPDASGSGSETAWETASDSGPAPDSNARSHRIDQPSPLVICFPRRRLSCPTLTAALACWALLGFAAATPAEANGGRAAALGLERAKVLHGGEIPTGRGVTFGHVEGEKGSYVPDRSKFENVNFVLKSGESETNGHAHSTSKVIYGPGGLAPGVGQVLLYHSRDWLTDGYLRAGTGEAPRVNNARVLSHSWIANSRRIAPNVLRRVDYVADEYEVLVVAGVNNKRASSVPPLLGSGYNLLAVGGRGGDSSGGYTQVEIAGRCKPDLVGPAGLTSFATPAVAAVVGRLVEAVDRLDRPVARLARHSEVVRALMLSGAQKPGGWKPEKGKPLDEHLGAGMARFDYSYDILLQPPARPGAINTRYGWAFQTLNEDQTHVYRFSTANPLRDINISLVWNRRIDGREVTDPVTGRQVWIDRPRMSNFDLTLRLITSRGDEQPLAVSNSSIDNVEHIHFDELPAGRYEMVVNRLDGEPEAWDYALAWRMDRKQNSPRRSPP